MIFAPSGTALRIAHLPGYLRDENDVLSAEQKVHSLKEMERVQIQRVLKLCHGNQSRAAKMLGISPVTLWRKLKGTGA